MLNAISAQFLTSMFDTIMGDVIDRLDHSHQLLLRRLIPNENELVEEHVVPARQQWMNARLARSSEKERRYPISSYSQTPSASQPKKFTGNRMPLRGLELKRKHTTASQDSSLLSKQLTGSQSTLYDFLVDIKFGEEALGTSTPLNTPQPVTSEPPVAVAPTAQLAPCASPRIQQPSQELMHVNSKINGSFESADALIHLGQRSAFSTPRVDSVKLEPLLNHKSSPNLHSTIHRSSPTLSNLSSTKTESIYEGLPVKTKSVPELNKEDIEFKETFYRPKKPSEYDVVTEPKMPVCVSSLESIRIVLPLPSSRKTPADANKLEHHKGPNPIPIANLAEPISIKEQKEAQKNSVILSPQTTTGRAVQPVDQHTGSVRRRIQLFVEREQLAKVQRSRTLPLQNEFRGQSVGHSAKTLSDRKERKDYFEKVRQFFESRASQPSDDSSRVTPSPKPPSFTSKSDSQVRSITDEHYDKGSKRFPTKKVAMESIIISKTNPSLSDMEAKYRTSTPLEEKMKRMLPDKSPQLERHAKRELQAPIVSPSIVSQKRFSRPKRSKTRPGSQELFKTLLSRESVETDDDLFSVSSRSVISMDSREPRVDIRKPSRLPRPTSEIAVTPSPPSLRESGGESNRFKRHPLQPIVTDHTDSDIDSWTQRVRNNRTMPGLGDQGIESFRIKIKKKPHSLHEH